MDYEQFSNFLETGKLPFNTSEESEEVEEVEEDTEEQEEVTEDHARVVETPTDYTPPQSVESTDIDYKATVEEIFKPFKANGK